MHEELQVLELNAELDRLLGIDQAPIATTPERLDGSQEGLPAAAQLIAADFRSELRPRSGLQARWTARCYQLEEKTNHPVSLLRTRWAWATLAAVLALAALFVFRQPVLAAVGRLFGYGYFPQAGFVPLEGTRVLRNSVRQEYAGSSLTVRLGVATPDRTNLWLEYSGAARPTDGAWLETPNGERLDLISWTWDPNRTGTRGVRLEFPPLPIQSSQVTLALPEGWRLPLEWILATGAGLPSTDVRAPYPTLGRASVSTAGPESPTQVPVTTDPPCVQAHGLRVCLAAAQADEAATRVLLEATSLDAQLAPGGDSLGFILPNPLSGDQEISLKDDLGNVARLEAPLDPVQRDGERLLRPLAFPPLAAQAKQLTLHVPAFEASVPFAAPLELSVDLGADPQPGQVLAVDQELAVLGQTLRFRQATLSGDGTSNLRVTLTSDPVEGGKDMIVVGLDLGKPEGIDDRYGAGGGGPQGVVKVFTELIGPLSGRKTGVLTFPVWGASVLLLGPFEFTFPAPMPAPAASTPPVVIDGESFSPLPTPTPLSLDSYEYTGRAIQPGELLFTVMGETTTELYAFDSQSSAAPERVASLPGQVYQVFLHTDRKGIDYLAGTRVSDPPPSRLTFYRSAHVYTLRFTDPQPRLLVAFPRGPENVQGTELTANWSYDGRLMVFELHNNYPKPGEPWASIGWIDLACRQTGNCQPQYLEIPPGMELNRPKFSPKTYQVLISGADQIHGGHNPDVYQFEFGADGQLGALSNLTNSDQIFELSPNWLPDGSGFFTACWDSSIPINAYDLCQHGTTPGQGQHLLRLPGNMQDITLSPDGKRLADYSYIENKEQIRVYELETRKTTLISGEGDWPFFGFTFSVDGKYLALLRAGSDPMPTSQDPGMNVGGTPWISLYSLATGQERQVFESSSGEDIPWMGWVR